MGSLDSFDEYDMVVSDNLTMDDGSWSAYSISYYYDECPNQSVESARVIIEERAPLYNDLDKVYIEVILPLMLAIGIMGNLFFLYVVCRMTSMRTATNWCLANLAIADLIFLAFGIGQKIWMYHHSPFVNDHLSLGELGCPIIIAFIDASYFAALCMVTLVSVERFYAVCRTHSARINARKSVFIALVILSWIVSFAIAASFSPASSNMYVGCVKWPDVEPYKSLPQYRGTCISPSHLQKYPLYVNIFKTVPYFALLLLNVWLYVRIIMSMTRAVHETRITGRADSNLAQRNQVARMLIMNGVVFFVCLVPFEVFCLIQAVNISQPPGESFFTKHTVVTVRYVSQAMSYLNNIVNPFIYIGMSKRYRDAFKNAICCRRVAGPSPGIKTRMARSSTTTSTALSVHQNNVILGDRRYPFKPE